MSSPATTSAKSNTPPAVAVGEAEWMFYDGYCGLCHRAVRFVLLHDHDGSRFRFTPLQGKHIQSLVPAAQRARLPDSIVVRTADGRLLIRSAAFLHIFRRLGGQWKLLAGIAALIPRPIRDGVYDFIARIRHRIFRRPTDVCPIVSPDLRARFDD